jgi:hypothetical protein
MSKPPVKSTWRALSDGWVAGLRVTKGQEIELTAQQAKYEPVELVVPEVPASARRRSTSEAAGS